MASVALMACAPATRIGRRQIAVFQYQGVCTKVTKACGGRSWSSCLALRLRTLSLLRARQRRRSKVHTARTDDSRGVCRRLITDPQLHVVVMLFRVELDDGYRVDRCVFILFVLVVSFEFLSLTLCF